MSVEKWIEEHRHDDVNELALRAAHYPEVDMREAIVQIRGWQIAEKKLPMWAETQGIWFPDHLPLEQCSSQLTAEYNSFLFALTYDANISKLTPASKSFGAIELGIVYRMANNKRVNRKAMPCPII